MATTPFTVSAAPGDVPASEEASDMPIIAKLLKKVHWNTGPRLRAFFVVSTAVTQPRANSTKIAITEKMTSPQFIDERSCMLYIFMNNIQGKQTSNTNLLPTSRKLPLRNFMRFNT